jgi:lipopolysaccharide export LptBFGC system permease protein LptF
VAAALRSSLVSVARVLCHYDPVILFAYLCRAVAVRLALALPSLVLVYVAFDLGDAGRRLASEVGWPVALHAALLHLPLVAVQVLPAALALGSVLTLWSLRSQGELEAMSAAGAGPLRLCLPLLHVGFLCAVCAFLVDETIVPICEREIDRLLGTWRPSLLTGLGPAPEWTRRGPWFLHLVRAARPPRVLGLQITPSFEAVRRFDGALLPRAGASGHTMRLGTSRSAQPPGLSLRPEGLDDAVALWREAAVRAEAQSFVALRRRLQALSAMGQGRRAEEVVLHAKLAFPWLNLLAVLLVCPIAFRRERRSALWEMLAALGLLLGLWLLLATGWFAARVGWLGPAAGAWLPLLVGSILCVVRIWYALRGPDEGEARPG